MHLVANQNKRDRYPSPAPSSDAEIYAGFWAHDLTFRELCLDSQPTLNARLAQMVEQVGGPDGKGLDCKSIALNK